jgi:hypothetical protein
VTTDARSTYEQGRESFARRVRLLERKAQVLATSRLVLAAAAIVLLAAVVWTRLGSWAWGGILVIVFAFVALVMVHARVHDAKDRAAVALRFYERGLARIGRQWDRLPASSARFVSADHPFARDLDVFGRASLMQLVDATETTFGEEHLAHLLSLEDPGPWPEDASSRQTAVRDLASRTAFREAVATSAGILAGERASPAPLIAWAEANDGIPRWLVCLAWAVPPLVAAGALIGSAFGLSAPTIALVAALVAAGAVAAGRRVAPMLESVSTRESSATRWRATLTAVEREPFEAPLLAALRARLAGRADGAPEARERPASEEVAALERIVGFADARRNEVFRLLVGPLLMWDVHCAIALLRWRRRAGTRLRGWLDAIGEVEALASLAAFAFERPDFVWPELLAEPEIDAQGLAHPLIADDRRVGNDVRLSAGRALVVTGSNMSGKSTLLRAIGVNAVLAAAGAPVCAKAMRIGPSRVATSMRFEDSLAESVSHFYAELGRLKRVIDLALETGRAPVLFLLDEILHGTNSRERILGARAVVRTLLAHGAYGAISTHDLGITALERELAGRVENVHFEEQVAGSTMTFDYRLRPGIVQSSNALRLMRAMGIAVDEA